jgi:hypothetical protein
MHTQFSLPGGLTGFGSFFMQVFLGQVQPLDNVLADIKHISKDRAIDMGQFSVAVRALVRRDAHTLAHSRTHSHTHTLVQCGRS